VQGREAATPLALLYRRRGVRSRDENGEEVDSGRYEVVREDRLVFNDVLFNYRIRGDVITLEPVTPECTPCFAHAWDISVASPGGAWERIGA
jgi:hypothetical protein